MAKKPRQPSERPGEGPERWVIKDEVWHPGAGRMIRRKDGKPFRFPIRNPKRPKGKSRS